MYKANYVMIAIALMLTCSPAIAAPEVGAPCSTLGESKKSSTNDAIIGCLKSTETASTDCSSGCTWKYMSSASTLPDGVLCGSATGNVGKGSILVKGNLYNLAAPNITLGCGKTAFVSVTNSGNTHIFYDKCPDGFRLAVSGYSSSCCGSDDTHEATQGTYTAQCISGTTPRVSISATGVMGGSQVYKIVK